MNVGERVVAVCLGGRGVVCGSRDWKKKSASANDGEEKGLQVLDPYDDGKPEEKD